MGRSVQARAAAGAVGGWHVCVVACSGCSKGLISVTAAGALLSALHGRYSNASAHKTPPFWHGCGGPSRAAITALLPSSTGTSGFTHHSACLLPHHPQVGEFVEVSNGSDTDPCAWLGCVEKVLEAGYLVRGSRG